jgi:hypothetical protein
MPDVLYECAPIYMRRPIFDPGMGIEFNGDATSDLAGDTFTVMAPLFTHPTATAQGMCRTGAKPYDLAVTALLLRCVQLLPDVFALDSDGGWDTDWATGHPPASGPIASPRNLVGMLFDPYPDASPFTDVTQFLTHHR